MLNFEYCVLLREKFTYDILSLKEKKLSKEGEFKIFTNLKIKWAFSVLWTFVSFSHNYISLLEHSRHFCSWSLYLFFISFVPFVLIIKQFTAGNARKLLKMRWNTKNWINKVSEKFLCSFTDSSSTCHLSDCLRSSS